MTQPKPWYRNPIAVMGYFAQAVGVVMAVASYIVASPPPGMPGWVLPVCGIILAIGSKASLDYHSAKVRTAELATAAAPLVQSWPRLEPPAAAAPPLQPPGPVAPLVPPGAAAPA